MKSQAGVPPPALAAAKQGPKSFHLHSPWGRECAQCAGIHRGGKSQEKSHISPELALWESLVHG